MSALPYELALSQQISAGAELFDVNQVLTDALELSDQESIAAIAAHNVVYMRPYANEIVRGSGKLAVFFTIEHEQQQTSRTITLEIDDQHRPLPEQLITHFGALAIRSDRKFGRIERFDFS